MKQIADTGLLVALLTRNDLHHDWAVDAFRRSSPFHTCDAVLAEAGSFFPNPVALLTLVSRGDVIIDGDFVLAAELPRILTLSRKYADRPMDLADACLVRMTELNERCKIWTVDREDFATYRRHGRQPVPCAFPPE
ncbi:MAG: type II toxin-antitoxin system VapC family toxin [Verrucomicrobiales bacterium]